MTRQASTPSKGVQRVGVAFKLSTAIIGGALVVLAGAFAYNYSLSKKIIYADMEDNVRHITSGLVSVVAGVLEQIEIAPASLVFTFEKSDEGASEIDVVEKLKDAAQASPLTADILVAFEPGGFRQGQTWFAPTVYRDGEGLSVLFRGGPDDPYFHEDWYILPKELKRPVWGEPYYDHAGRAVKCVHSRPFYRWVDGERRFAGVVAAGLSLDGLQSRLERTVIYRTGYAALFSRNGVIISHPAKDWIMRESIFSRAQAFNQPELRALGRDMIRGGAEFRPMTSTFTGKKSFIRYAPINRAGWSLGVVIPDEELFADLRSVAWHITVGASAGMLGLFLIVVGVSNAVVRPLRALADSTLEIARGNLDAPLPPVRSGDEVGRLQDSFENMRQALKEYITDLTATTAAKERIESELKIARNIQLNFLPRNFPPFPHRREFELFASLESAKEVGGDLYDFFLLGEDALFFSIGDVSDKGVPAALFMAVTKTLVKGMARPGLDPAELLRLVNLELMQGNESTMFTTLFCAVLDLKSGRLIHSNAGHTPPVLIRRGKAPVWLDVPPGLMLGVMEFDGYTSRAIDLEPGDALFCYTDGVTEGRNPEQELYGEGRLLAAVAQSAAQDPKTLVAQALADLKAFVDRAPQSDDITVLALTWKGRSL